MPKFKINVLKGASGFFHNAIRKSIEHFPKLGHNPQGIALGNNRIWNGRAVVTPRPNKPRTVSRCGDYPAFEIRPSNGLRSLPLKRKSAAASAAMYTQPSGRDH